MKTNTLVLGSIVSSFFTLSCGSTTEKKVENTYRAPELQSDWAGGCESSGFLPLSTSVAIKFESVNFKRSLFLASDASCAMRDIEVAYAGEYKLGTANEAQQAIKSLPIDLSYKGVTVTPLTEVGRNTLNTVRFCDHADWALNVAVDISALSTLASCPLLDLPQIQYDIVSTEGGILRFGATGIKSAPTVVAERPTTLNGLTLNGN